MYKPSCHVSRKQFLKYLFSMSASPALFKAGPHLESHRPSTFCIMMVPLLTSLLNHLVSSSCCPQAITFLSPSCSSVYYYLLYLSFFLSPSLFLFLLFLTSIIDCIYLFAGYYCYSNCTLTCIFLIIIIFLPFPFPFISCLK